MQAIVCYAEGFFTQWKINIHDSMSLPGIAEKIAYLNFDDSCAPIYSFGGIFKKYNEGIFRNKKCSYHRRIPILWGLKLRNIEF